MRKEAKDRKEARAKEEAKAKALKEADSGGGAKEDESNGGIEEGNGTTTTEQGSGKEATADKAADKVADGLADDAEDKDGNVEGDDSKAKRSREVEEDEDDVEETPPMYRQARGLFLTPEVKHSRIFQKGRVHIRNVACPPVHVYTSLTFMLPHRVNQIAFHWSCS